MCLGLSRRCTLVGLIDEFLDVWTTLSIEGDMNVANQHFGLVFCFYVGVGINRDKLDPLSETS